MKHIHFTPKILLAALTMLLMSHPLSSRAQAIPDAFALAINSANTTGTPSRICA